MYGLLEKGTLMTKEKLNSSLTKAKNGKNDEFYTQLTDIEKELGHYEDHFKGKVVYCNCDDPSVSWFFYYFLQSFNDLKLKKLITTCFKNDKMDLFSEGKTEKAIYLKYEGNKNGNGMPDPKKIETKPLKDNGDFRKPESIALLKQADIVVTNPPFSLFRQYIAQLIEYDKKFLIIGNLNAITYKETFKLFKENKLWFGASIKSGDREFGVPNNYPLNAASSRIDENGNKFIRVKGVRWFTNLDYEERYIPLPLYKEYNPEDYPKYDNYDAINVNKTADIPKDYDGAMGVPITFMDKYNPNQFEIIGLGISSSGLEVGVQPYKKEHKKYRKEVQKRGAVDGDLYMMIKGEVTVPYARILIRRKKSWK